MAARESSGYVLFPVDSDGIAGLASYLGRGGVRLFPSYLQPGGFSNLRRCFLIIDILPAYLVGQSL